MRFSAGIAEYVNWKNFRGVQFRDREHLIALCTFVGDRPLRSVTPLQVLSFLDGKRVSAATWWRQYKVIRSFFEFWLLRGEVKRVPMPRPRLAWPEPFKPYIYSRDELRRLLEATRTFMIGHWARIDPLTLRTLILLMYGTGARPREVIALRFDSFDFRQRLVTLGDRTVGRARTIPFGPTLKRHLVSYVKMREEACSTCPKFFLDKRGRPVVESTLRGTFQRLRKHAGVERSGGGNPPGFRDLRHTFAVHRIMALLERGGNARGLLPALSAYMGHVKWVYAERYLALTPERFYDQLSRLGPVNDVVSVHSKKGKRLHTPFGEIPPRIRWRERLRG